jgi:hypothetical protein
MPLIMTVPFTPEPTMTENRVTPCECHPERFPLECHRHHCWKSESLYVRCRTEPESFALWEAETARRLEREQRGSPPTALQKAWNLAQSLAAFVADGMHTVSTDEYRRRLAICNACAERDDTTCRVCGCHLPLKAQGRAFDCPLAKWSTAEPPPSIDTS